MAKKLTDLFVKKVDAAPRRAEYQDGHTRGLVLRITPNGKKSWAVNYRRKSDARKRRYTIGAYPQFSLDEARNEARQILAAVARREDPAGQVQTRKASLTFAQLAAAWINGHGRPNKVARALYDDQLMLNREIYPAIGAMKADEVCKRDVIRILDTVAERGARVRSNRVFALLRSIYRWGVAEDLVKSDPTLGVRPRTVERPRDRVLTDEEVNIFWHSLAGAPMTKAVATMLRLALVTGQRIGEIAGMTKTEVDLTVGNPMWTQAGARRKNKEMTRVPLVAAGSGAHQRRYRPAPVTVRMCFRLRHETMRLRLTPPRGPLAGRDPNLAFPTSASTIFAARSRRGWPPSVSTPTPSASSSTTSAPPRAP